MNDEVNLRRRMWNTPNVPTLISPNDSNLPYSLCNLLASSSIFYILTVIKETFPIRIFITVLSVQLQEKTLCFCLHILEQTEWRQMFRRDNAFERVWITIICTRWHFASALRFTMSIWHLIKDLYAEWPISKSKLVYILFEKSAFLIQTGYACILSLSLPLSYGCKTPVHPISEHWYWKALTIKYSNEPGTSAGAVDAG